MRILPLAAAAILILASSSTIHAAVLWTTGDPKPVKLDDTTGNPAEIRYISGRVDATTPQRIAAVPFRIAMNSHISSIRALYTDNENSVRTNPEDVSYTIWQRSGLDAPGAVVAEGSFGKYAQGQQFQATGITPGNDYIHTHAVDFPLAAGDYYFSLFSKDKLIYWVTGGDQQLDPSLEQNFIWRSSVLPSPGFQQFVYGGDVSQLADKKDVYNPIFSIIGEPVPEPSAGVLAAVFGLLVAQRRGRTLCRQSPQHN